MPPPGRAEGEDVVLAPAVSRGELMNVAQRPRRPFPELRPQERQYVESRLPMMAAGRTGKAELHVGLRIELHQPILHRLDHLRRQLGHRRRLAGKTCRRDAAFEKQATALFRPGAFRRHPAKNEESIPAMPLGITMRIKIRTTAYDAFRH